MGQAAAGMGWVGGMPRINRYSHELAKSNINQSKAMDKIALITSSKIKKSLFFEILMSNMVKSDLVIPGEAKNILRH